MVDYQGNVVRASKSENQDLLWASCGGGGGNLGVVTSFTVKPISLSKVPFVTSAVIDWLDHNSTVQLFDKVRQLSLSLSAIRLTIGLASFHPLRPLE